MGEHSLISPEKFDVVVVGTGLVESLIAASAAYCGVKVLQIDAVSYYGGTSSTLPCRELAEHFKGACRVYDAVDEFASVLEPRLLARALFDVSPKVLYGDGPLISLLLKTGAHNYTEFKLVEGRLMWQDSSSSFVPIAASRAEIFKDTSMSLKQKHVLMKTLKGILGEEEDVDLTGELLARFGGDDVDLVDRFVHGVLLRHDASKLSTSEARNLVELYGRSGGKYGPGTGPFLYPIHGTAELSQAFCRTAAVHGATQCLRCHVEEIRHDERAYHIRLANGQVIHASSIAASQECLPHPAPVHVCWEKDRETVCRCYALVLGRVFMDHHQCLSVIPRGSAQGMAVWMLQLDDSTYHCPSGWSCLHVWTVHKGNSEVDCVAELKGVLQRHLDCSAIFKEEQSPGHERPKVAFACFVASESSTPDGQSALPNFAVCHNHPGDVSFIHARDEAIRSFGIVCPEHKFPFDDAEIANGVNHDEMAGSDQEEESMLSALEEALAE
ncbi:hypothetical protein M9435_003867 [Picochlorum sp. BPE23]|nr:hypothetical protein M9435_003867 [Picochlorum sp. BPE23]